MIVEHAKTEDLVDLLQLYTQLHLNPMPQIDSKLIKHWNQIINDENHHIIVLRQDNKILSSCVIVIIPNLTHNQRPYALIENVITDKNCRNKGYATKCLDYAKAIALKENCYKIMLLTGSKEPGTLDFYRKSGYNSDDKTAFIQWL